ncbi:chemosensory protein [Asbolus verrucosus]|uniref:Chemosensory protein n=1 Tax=Asbolus verrucosus TaxID=1661398 RepID=A0A482VHR0_ASBVE|nr:chemosensory protein [Asbolus verrucosus]
MKTTVVLLFLTVVVTVYARPEEKYTTKYDNVDLDEIIKSDRLLKNYVNCLLEKGKCTPDGSELKRVLPDALHSECTIVIVAFAAVIGLALARPESEEKYTTKYDDIDLDEILKSKRLIMNYFNCLMEKGPCTADGEELRKVLPDALHNGCQKCSEKHKNGARKIVRHLIDNERELWDQLEAKYDENKEYRKKYQAEIEKEGLKL